MKQSIFVIEIICMVKYVLYDIGSRYQLICFQSSSSYLTVLKNPESKNIRIQTEVLLFFLKDDFGQNFDSSTLELVNRLIKSA